MFPNMHCLKENSRGFIDEDEQKEFRKWLDGADRNKIDLATDYYNEVITMDVSGKAIERPLAHIEKVALSGKMSDEQKRKAVRGAVKELTAGRWRGERKSGVY